MMDATIRLNRRHYEALIRALFRRVPQEGAAFLLAGVSRGRARVVLTVRECLELPDEDLRSASEGHIELRPSALLKAVNRANESGAALVEAHSHPFSAKATFSAVDERGLEQILPYMLGSLSGRVYGATVWGREGFQGRVWQGPAPAAVPVAAVETVGKYDPYPATGEILPPGERSPLRTDRLDRAIGAGARERIRKTRFAIVGLGGLGSQLLSSLLSIGAARFVLIDPDTLKEENIDRIPYAKARDAGRSAAKVALAARYIRARVPDADIVAVPKGLDSTRALAALKEADFLFGAVDTYYGRLTLTRFAAAYLLPYLDCGTGVNVRDGGLRDMGGRVTVLIPGEHCLVCAGRIDSRELNYELADDAEQSLSRNRGYVRGLDVPQPMVGTLNGAIANLAATEAIGILTGIKRPAEQLFYDALSGTVSEVSYSERDECRICDGLLGLADGAEVGSHQRRAC